MTGIETDIAGRLRLRASELGVTLWRNNSGAAFNRDGRPVRFGLGNDSRLLSAAMKSSDLIGIASNGRFIALEIKKPGWHFRGTEREIAQRNFIDHVRRNSGIAGFVTSVEDMTVLL